MKIRVKIRDFLTSKIWRDYTVPRKTLATSKLLFMTASRFIIFVMFWYIGFYHIMSPLKEIFVLLAGVGTIISLYILDRVTIFKKKFSLAVQHIMDNNFQTGISMSGKDEIVTMGEEFNSVVDRINDYDMLRENKILCLNRLTNMINRNIQNGIMILDLDSGRIKINKFAQEMFGVNQDDLSIDSVIKLTANTEFNRLYQQIIEGRSNTITGSFEFFLPILKAKANVEIKMLGIKDNNEELHTILCVFTKIASTVERNPEVI